MTDREQVAALLRRHTLAMVEHSPPSLIEDMGHCWRVQCSCGETFDANSVREVVLAHCDHLADVVSASDTGATRAEDDIARFLDGLADRWRSEMSSAWGGQRSWITTGDHIAELVTEWVREEAAELREGGDHD